MATPSKKKTRNKTVSEGVVHANVTFNNTKISITTNQGEVLAWSSSGNCGFKGARKGTPYAGQLVAEKVAKAVKDKYKMDYVEIRISGFGPGRDSVIRQIAEVFDKVKKLTDVTPLPHNGCRPPKKRRV